MNQGCLKTRHDRSTRFADSNSTDSDHTMGSSFSPQLLTTSGAPVPIAAVSNPPAVPFWKRALDLFCIFVALPALVPFMALIAVYIKLVSRGPVFFRQARVGLNGKTFDCLKFRSMKLNADTQVHQNYLKQLMQNDKPMTKMDIKGDPRLIPMGWLLRSTGLDELPQLINVLLGDMSIVGPRPCTRYEYDQYLPWHKRRFTTLPGLTGLWQVSGKNRTTFSEMIHLDVYYAENKSLALDIRIMLRTFPALLDQVKETKSAQPSVAASNGTDGKPSNGAPHPAALNR